MEEARNEEGEVLIFPWFKKSVAELDQERLKREGYNQKPQPTKEDLDNIDPVIRW